MMKMSSAVRTVAALAFAAAVLFGVSARAAERTVLLLNTADQPIFEVHVGHAGQNAWSSDLLGFDDVIDVSRGREVRIPFNSAGCSYDVSATYRDGLVVVLHDVDLCRATRLSFRR
jgi:hypothetical protein